MKDEPEKNFFGAIYPSIPIELVTEILSWSPVKSLLAFRSVCKEWNELIQDAKFIRKHLIQSRYIGYYAYEYKENGDRFKLIHTCDGLVLELCEMSKKYRIRNVLTRRVFDLPNTQHKTKLMYIIFIPGCGYKAVSVYDCRDKKPKYNIGLELITLGSEENPSWRTLDSCFSNSLYIINGVIYLVTWAKDNFELIRLDLKSECFTSSIVSRWLFSNPDNVQLMRYEDEFALAEISENELQLLVFEDYKKGKWADKKIVIPLKFLKGNSDINSGNYLAESCKDKIIRFKTNDGFHLHYDITKEKVTSSRKIDEKLKIIFTCSLVSFKGMRPLWLN